ncbi:MAG TPA: hypothetical protein VJM46_03465, partial [Candidatus Saccharimonadales bacterium]|nr:hypothetical protein [Candidatus Saccharimonadales bacterium]
MTNAIPLHAHDGLATLPMRQFNDRFAATLPGLIRLMRSPELREHPKWGSLVPFAVPTYGDNPSVGHICRPDVILTANGPRVTEIDFVPSGRGWTLLGVPRERRGAHLAVYRDWYAAMGYSGKPIYYATGSTTVCREETDYFAAMMQRIGVDMRSVNIDRDRMRDAGLIDRLFYRAELRRRFRLGKHQIITAEPWFDSKIIFAVVHDTTMDRILVKYLGQAGLSFLRTVLIRTHLLEDVVRARDSRLDRLIENRTNWVLKSTEVEESWSWGARSVVLGNRTGKNNWEAAVRFAAGNPPRKELGAHPIFQPFSQSLDFAAHWNGVVQGHLTAPDPARFGKPSDNTTRQPAKRQVYARVGVYFLVDSRS